MKYTLILCSLFILLAGCSGSDGTKTGSGDTNVNVSDGGMVTIIDNDVRIEGRENPTNIDQSTPAPVEDEECTLSEDTCEALGR